MKILLLIFYLVLVSCSNKYVIADENIISKFSLSGGDVLLMVKVTDTQYTSYYPDKDNCPDELYCIPKCFWFNHDAKVLNVLSGEYKEKNIKFSVLQHVDNSEEILNEWYVQLRKFKQKSIISKLKSKYYVEKHNAEFSLCY